jgi:exopolysaccharide biosynthesis protein
MYNFRKNYITVAVLISLNTVMLAGCGSVHSINTTAETWTMPTTDVPLGPVGAPQTITNQRVTAGVTYYQIKRGAQGPSDFWTVNIGFYPTKAAAQADAAAVTAAGFTTRFDQSAGTGTDGSILGYYLSVGKFSTQTDAKATGARIAQATANKYRPATRNTALAGNVTTGPWIINILAIEPSQTTAKLAYELPGGNNLGGTGETVSVAASRLGVLAGMNAGFFSNINPFNSTLPPRSPIGTTVVNGKLIGTAAGGRPGVMITTTSNGHPKVTVLPKLTSSTTLTDVQNASIAVKAIDRPILGTVANCGTPAESPNTTPKQDYVCTNFDDLVMYDSLFLQGKLSNTLINASYRGAAYELVVDSTGTVVTGHSTLGTPAPQGGFVLQGLGKSASWLQSHAAAGTKLTVVNHVYSSGKELALTPGMTIVEAGPSLSVSNLLQNAWTEGFSPNVNGNDNGDSAGTPNSSWYEGWVVTRNGRTAIGIGADGTIFLVEIDGRQPTVSLGTSIPETAAVMSWLGAVSAINLDGGGSSNMVVSGAIVGHPSDATGERGVGGTLMVEASK